MSNNTNRPHLPPVWLPGPKKFVSIRCYVEAWQTVRANPDKTFPQSICGWWPATGEEIRRQFATAMDERITAGRPLCRPRVAVEKKPPPLQETRPC